LLKPTASPLCGLHRSLLRDHGDRRVGLPWLLLLANSPDADDHERHVAVTSLGGIFAGPDTPNVDSAHIEDGVRAWLADLDPDGNPGFRDRVLRAVADAAARYERLGLIPAQDGAQAALAWIAEHPDKLRQWSGADGLMVTTIRNKISTAARAEHGDRRVTIGGREHRIYFASETPFSELADAERKLADDELTFDDAVQRRLSRRGTRAGAPSAEDAYFTTLDGDWTSETPTQPWLPMEFKVKLGGRCIDGHYQVPLDPKARLELPLMSRELYRAQRVALGTLSATERQLLIDHHGKLVPLQVLADRIRTTKGALERRLRRRRKKVLDFFEAKFPELSDSGADGQVLELGGHDMPAPDARGHDHAAIDHRHRATGAPHGRMSPPRDAGHLPRPVVPVPDRGPRPALHRPGGSKVRGQAARGAGDSRGGPAR
jgi:hypothetical protein